jgi:hypothetical protein
LTPGGRFRSEGNWSGEEFREVLLTPKITAGDDIVVDLDGPLGFTTSFLEEVFGGLVRAFGPSIKDRIQIRAIAKPTRAQKAHWYMERAIAGYSK